jgi:SWI/SNF-related matrix-associated actin-dependent regulator of chromatin subfamily A3
VLVGSAAGSALNEEIVMSSDEENEDDGKDAFVGKLVVGVAIPVREKEEDKVTVHQYQRLMLVLEPTNSFDGNAIRVQTLMERLVGYVCETQAKVLTSFFGRMMRGELQNLRLEVYSVQQLGLEDGRHHIDVKINFFGANKEDLARHRDPVGQLQFAMAKAKNPEFQELKAEDMEAKALAGLEHFEGNVAYLEALPMHEPTNDIVTSTLFDYQKQGLWWMLQREKEYKFVYDPYAPGGEQEGILFYIKAKHPTTGEGVYYNSELQTAYRKKPHIFRGGVLSDDMGLGKTLQVIACIAENHERPTLIICNKSLISNWTMQIRDHTRENSLNVIVYYGKEGDKMTLHQLEYADVVITTYDKIGSLQEKCGLRVYKRKKNETDKQKEKREKMERIPIKRTMLFELQWGRIVLDEAHFIRNPSSYRAQACRDLRADVRWCLTGTPIQNKVDDFYSLLLFLRVRPFSDRKVWNAKVASRLKQARTSEAGVAVLRQLMRDVCLRRLKTMKFHGEYLVHLPEKTSLTVKVKMLPEETKVYEVMQEDAQRIFRLLLQNDLVRSRYGFILLMLLRMRQCCDGKDLVPDKFLNGFKQCLDEYGGEAALMNAEGVKKMKKMLEKVKAAVLANEKCCICFSEPADDPVSTPCCHVFCRECIEEVIDRNNSPSAAPTECPLCRAGISKKSLVGLDKEAAVMEQEAKLAEEEKTKKKGKKGKKGKRKGMDLTPSGKISRLIQDLGAVRDANPRNKSVVFSQWSTMLRLVALHMDELRQRDQFEYLLFTGDMDSDQRIDVLEDFCDPNSRSRVLLISLGCGNVGLNLTVANHLYMLDPWWNPYVEQQAQDRVYRVGQLQEVTVTRYVIDDSVEDRVLKIQAAKRRRVSQIMGAPESRMSKEEQKQAMIEDLKHVFGVGEVEDDISGGFMDNVR